MTLTCIIEFHNLFSDASKVAKCPVIAVCIVLKCLSIALRLSGFHGNCMALTPMCLSHLLQVVLGQKVTRPCVFDQQLLQSILDCQNNNSFLTRLGGTMCTDDFYEGVCVCVCVVPFLSVMLL